MGSVHLSVLPYLYWQIRLFLVLNSFYSLHRSEELHGVNSAILCSKMCSKMCTQMCAHLCCQLCCHINDFTVPKEQGVM